jgi:PhzF family phenazine biosynthesis protein
MKTLNYRKVDAFTAGGSLGNPAACIYLRPGETLTDAEMLAVAKQHKGFVTEVVYCAEQARGEFSLSYYSSECEVDFCGHGTIACMHTLIAETPELRDQKEIPIRTNKKGDLTVYNELAARNAVFITAPEPRFIGSRVAAEEIAESMSLDAGRIAGERPVDVIDAGLRTLIIPLASLRDEISLFPDEQRLKAFCEKIGVDIVLIYSLETADPKNAAHTLVFAPRFGYLEDPATGSGNSAFGHYMLKNNLWDGSPATIEQGGEDRVFNSVQLSAKEGRVLFGGGATVRITGGYCL